METTTLINLHDLQHLLFDIKDQFQSHPQLDLPAYIKSDIQSYYKFLKIQAFVLTDTLPVTLTIPLVVKIIIPYLRNHSNMR